ncbi:MAG TPA: DUF484 family protein [Xanthomonadales bacterium]|nr:DUF484 family protein [Xanthomonadales bacterium]
MKPHFAILLAALVCGAPSPGFAGSTGEEPRQGEEEQVIEYLRDHPEFLIDHPEFLQRTNALRQQAEGQAQLEQRLALIRAQEDSLFRSEWTPVRGNPEAPYTLIEFSDYQCVPCKRSFPAIESFMEKQENVRLIQLQLPIYGPYSTMAARAALISNKLGDFGEYHSAMMQTPNPVGLESIEAALQVAGVSADEFSALMNESELADYLKAVKEFSIATNVLGTPAFLLNGVLLNGAVTEDGLDDAMAQLMQQGN